MGTLTIWINGEARSVREGLSVAAALLAETGSPVFRHTERRGEPRGMFCGMGVCFDCLVRIDGTGNLRACMTQVADGMRIETA